VGLLGDVCVVLEVESRRKSMCVVRRQCIIWCGLEESCVSCVVVDSCTVLTLG